MRYPIFAGIFVTIIVSGCSDVAEDHRPERPSLGDYVSENEDNAPGNKTDLGKLSRRWDCAGIKQTFRPTADRSRVEIEFNYLDGSSGTETASLTRSAELVSIELHFADEVTLYTYDSERDTLAWRDINGDSHVCSPA